MKKVLYICTKTIENWDIFTSFSSEDSTQSTISLLLLHQEQHLENVPVSQVWKLDRGDHSHRRVETQKTFFYQDFLEEVFLHDLSVVI
jgi:hypothetical protein